MTRRGSRPQSGSTPRKASAIAGSILRRTWFALVAIPLITHCTLPTELLPQSPPGEPLSSGNVRLATPVDIAPDFRLTTPPAIAPEIEVATNVELDPTQLTPSPTPRAMATLEPTATATSTATLTATSSPTGSFTPVTIWPTWTTAPTNTRTPSPVPTSTHTPVPLTEPPPAPSATTASPPDEPSPTSPSVPSDTPDPSGCSPSGNASYEATLIGLINEVRQAQGLHPLTQQSQLTAAARKHSDDMACNDFISHTGSDGSHPADRVTAQGYSYSWIGENIFAGSSGPQTAFDWWMNSEPHRNNILHSSYTEIGIGYSYLADGRYRNHYTAVFARPR